MANAQAITQQRIVLQPTKLRSLIEGTRTDAAVCVGMFLTLLLVQTIAGAPADIEISAVVRAKSLTIEKQGEASLTVTTDPPGRNVVGIEAPRANGRKTISNPVIRVNVQARIVDPLEDPKQSQSPQ